MFTLTTFQDFEDCGKVYQCIKKNSFLSDGQIAESIKIPVFRVKLVRKYLEEQRMIPKSGKIEPTVSENESGKEKIVELFSPPENVVFPVTIRGEYIARITRADEEVGLAFVSNFECRIFKGQLGDLVKFRITEMFGVYCNAELVQVIERNNNQTKKITTESIEKETESIPKTKAERAEEVRCLICHQKVDATKYETNEGLCSNCYYISLMAETNKEQRRSGIYGSDRAGTW